MMTARKRAHAEKMRSRRGVRPWDRVKEDAAFGSILRLRTLFEMGKADSEIAAILRLDVHLVSFLRDARCRRSRSETV